MWGVVLNLTNMKAWGGRMQVKLPPFSLIKGCSCIIKKNCGMMPALDLGPEPRVLPTPTVGVGPEVA